MYTILLSRGFNRSFGKLQRSGHLKDAATHRYKLIVTTLKKGESLPATCRDHALSGDFSAYRECHIKGDLLLVYERDQGERIITLVDIGTHSYPFG